VGGYGATGRVAVPDLLKSGDGELVIGGRDQAKLESMAAEFGPRVSATRLDVMDARSLEEFCARCYRTIMGLSFCKAAIVGGSRLR
jgi:saccharopine dehydrogenase-like NADP-dependent oxidoreductase